MAKPVKSIPSGDQPIPSVDLSSETEDQQPSTDTVSPIKSLSVNPQSTTEAKSEESPIIVAKPKSSARRKTSIREKAYAYAYTSPNSPTFHNGTKSYQEISPAVLYDTAKTEGSRYLSRPNVISEIQAIYDTIDWGSEVRQQQRAAIARHELTGKTVHRSTLDPETGAKVMETVRGPTYSTVLKALDQADKITGLYAQAEAQGEAIKPIIRELARQHLRDVKAAVQARRKAGGG